MWTVENACASGTSAYHEAVEAVRLGRFGCVLALGIDQIIVVRVEQLGVRPAIRRGREDCERMRAQPRAGPRQQHEVGRGGSER